MNNKSTNMRVNKKIKKQSGECPLVFISNMIAPKPSDNLKEALKEVEAFEKGEIKSKGYHNMDEMFMAICED